MKKVICFAVIPWLMSIASSANASPPAYPRNDLLMYLESDAVVEAVVVKVSRICIFSGISLAEKVLPPVLNSVRNISKHGGIEHVKTLVLWMQDYIEEQNIHLQQHLASSFPPKKLNAVGPVQKPTKLSTDISSLRNVSMLR